MFGVKFEAVINAFGPNIWGQMFGVKFDSADYQMKLDGQEFVGEDGTDQGGRARVQDNRKEAGTCDCDRSLPTHSC